MTRQSLPVLARAVLCRPRPHGAKHAPRLDASAACCCRRCRAVERARGEALGISCSAPMLLQFIVKPARSQGSAFGWHRDSDWCRQRLAQRHGYVSVWCALDDTTGENGALWVLPGSHGAAGPARPKAAGGRAEGGAGSGYVGSSETGPGGGAGGEPSAGAGHEGAVPLHVKAGTAVVMADTLLHCSGPNSSRHDRHAWMPQFSCGPLLWREGGAPVAFAAEYT